MAVIDVQVHAYERNYPGRTWVGHLNGPQSANGEEMVTAMDAVGVDGAIIVSTFNLYRCDPSYALSYLRSDTLPSAGRSISRALSLSPAFPSGAAAGNCSLRRQRSGDRLGATREDASWSRRWAAIFPFPN
jgi:predicted TIM-barrel fold metal-dependent hydrolase